MTIKIYIHFLFGCLFLIPTFLYCQNFEVEYDYQIKGDEIESLINEEEDYSYLIAKLRQTQKDIDNYPMNFIISPDGYSIDFKNSLEVDRKFQKVKLSKTMAVGFFGLNIHIFNNREYTYTTNDDKFITFYDLQKLGKWKITKIQKNILGHNCYKAYFETDIPELNRASIILPTTAWFTFDIPLSGGPTIFGNLPGLIIELETKAARFRATSITKTKDAIKKIEMENKKVLSFIESEKYFINAVEKEIDNKN
jgi:GLPGLI family protein